MCESAGRSIAAANMAMGAGGAYEERHEMSQGNTTSGGQVMSKILMQTGGGMNGAAAGNKEMYAASAHPPSPSTSDYFFDTTDSFSDCSDGSCSETAEKTKSCVTTPQTQHMITVAARERFFSTTYWPATLSAAQEEFGSRGSRGATSDGGKSTTAGTVATVAEAAAAAVETSPQTTAEPAGARASKGDTGEERNGNSIAGTTSSSSFKSMATTTTTRYSHEQELCVSRMVAAAMGRVVGALEERVILGMDEDDEGEGEHQWPRRRRRRSRTHDELMREWVLCKAEERRRQQQADMRFHAIGAGIVLACSVLGFVSAHIVGSMWRRP